MPSLRKDSKYFDLIAGLVVNASIPVFTLQPQSQTVDEYATATFTAAADNATSYQWYKNNIPVGENSSVYSLNAADIDKNAVIKVVATNASGSTTSNVVTLGVISYVYQLDGLTQYMQLSSNVNVLAGDIVKLHFKAPATTYNRAYFLSGLDLASNPSLLLYAADNNIDKSPPASTVRVDGVETSAFVYGGYHTISIECSASSYMKFIGVRYSLDQRFAAFPIFKMTVTRSGLEILNMPLNNKGQGANQLSTVGNVNAAIINYNVNGWVPV